MEVKNTAYIHVLHHKKKQQRKTIEDQKLHKPIIQSLPQLLEG